MTFHGKTTLGILFSLGVILSVVSVPMYATSRSADASSRVPQVRSDDAMRENVVRLDQVTRDQRGQVAGLRAEISDLSIRMRCFRGSFRGKVLVTR